MYFLVKNNNNKQQLNDFWKDLSSKLGITGAVGQIDETRKTVNKASTSIDNINTTANKLMSDYDYIKPILIGYFGIQVIMWVTEIINNIKSINKK